MANQEHLDILRQGVDVWNQWRGDNPNVLPDLAGVDLSGMDLHGVDFSSADLDSANLSFANLEGVNLNQAFLNKSILTCTNLTSGIIYKTSIRNAHMRQVILNRAALKSVDLCNSDLRKANFTDAHLYDVKLIEANLYEACLISAELDSTHLGGANLQGVDLYKAQIRDSNLGGADMSQCHLGWTVLADVDLTDAVGLDAIIHHGPSNVGIDTIYRSKGNIPDIFLRGAGVNKSFIEYMSSLVGEAIQFYSCFISYSNQDQEFSDRLFADLQSKGVRCWFAPENIKGGRKLYEQIPEAIRLYDKLLLVLSNHSMNSEWVKTEIYHARQDEIRNNKRKLFPIGIVPFSEIRNWEAFDADVGKDMAREVREYFIPDFSNWKDHDSYQKAFDRLLRDLKEDAASVITEDE